MGKKISFIFCLLLGICCFGVRSVAAEKQVMDTQVSERAEKQVNEQVELWIHSWGEDKKKVEGTDHLTFEIYDLTAWRNEHGGDEKEDKEQLLNTYATKEKMKEFIEEQQLKKVNQSELKVDGGGNVSVSVDRYSEDGKDAAYLILASGETGNLHMLPIILYLPQIHPETGVEARHLLIYGKYKDASEPPISTSSSEPIVESVAKISEPSASSKKNFPSTNDLIRNFTILGLLLILIGLLGFKKIKKEK